MKYAILGDLHFKKCKEYEQSYREKVLNFVYNYCKQNDVTQIVQLGDFFHDRKSLDVNLLYEIKELARKYLSFDKFTILIGNHDTYFNNTNEVNSLYVLENVIPNLEIIDKVKETEYGLIVPWLNESNIEDFTDKLSKSDSQYCFGHFEINTFEMMRGILAQNSFNDINTFKQFKKVFSGHYHLMQDKNNISYVGSLFQNDFGDWNDRKRFFIIDTIGNTIEEVKIPVTFFEKITFNTENDLNINLEEYKDKNTQFIFNLPTSFNREKLIEEITENIINYNIIDNSRLCNEEITIDTDENFSNLFTEYLNNNQNYDENRKTSLNNLFNEIYSKVVNI